MPAHCKKVRVTGMHRCREKKNLREYNFYIQIRAVKSQKVYIKDSHALLSST
jgi:hypothetical protein